MSTFKARKNAPIRNRGLANTMSLTSVVDDEEVPLIERLWSYITRNNLWKLNRKEKDNRYVIVHIDGMMLMDEDPELGTFILQHPNEARCKLVEFLKELQLLNPIKERLWIRQTAVPHQLTCFDALYKAPIQLDVASPFHVCGVVSRVGNVTTEVYCRRLRCVYCNKKIWKLTDFDSRDTICCPNQFLEEHQPSRVSIPAQKIHITVLSLADDRRFCQETEISVVLQEELVGVCKLGDLVEVFGSFQYQSPINKKRTLNFAEFNAICNNLVILRNPWDLLSPQRGPTFNQSELALECTCRLLQKAVKNIYPSMFLIGSLLSAVMVSNQRVDDHRDQIHVLMVNHGHDAYTKGMMKDVANLLSPVNQYMSLTEMTPHLRETVKPDQRSQKDVMVSAGHLTITRTGITVLDLTQYAKQDRQKLQDVLSKPFCCPHPGSEFTTPMTCTLWALMELFPSSRNLPDITHQLSEELCNLFDIVIPCALQFDSEYDQVAIDRLLNDDSCNPRTPRCGSMKCLLERACLMKRPRLTRDAKRLLQNYYTFIRRQNTGHERCVPVQVSESLLRLATASARLRLSAIIQPSPDATLAIKLTEETLLETGVYNQPTELLLDLDEVSRGKFDSFDQELGGMYEVIRRAVCTKIVEIEE